eukprot:Phypoly_transcript_12675.p1 GENE.Phypoly_transcript_12675~~Phypoly_transcript_12675.p1  ORF type:complete len:324 (+),score=43.07 Phypoly_transcript_12675:133-1104(+)
MTSTTRSTTGRDFVPEGLTLYDMHREPRPPVVDDSFTSIAIRNLNKDLTCPICLNIIHNTLTVMECLHRFCSGCISKSLRMGKKECPTCRIPCSTRRNLRPDPNFDSLIRVLYPDLEKYEKQEETRVQQINQEYVAKAVAASVEEGMKRQKQAKRQRDNVKLEKEYIAPKKEKKKEKDAKRPKKSKNGGLPQNTNNNTNIRIGLTLPPDEVSIAVAPHPGEKTLARLSRPFLRIPAGALVTHLIRFVTMKFPQHNCSRLKLVLGLGVKDSVAYAKGETNPQIPDLPEIDKISPLSESTPLPVLREMWKNPDEILVLYYLEPVK